MDLLQNFHLRTNFRISKTSSDSLNTVVWLSKGSIPLDLPPLTPAMVASIWATRNYTHCRTSCRPEAHTNGKIPSFPNKDKDLWHFGSHLKKKLKKKSAPFQSLQLLHKKVCFKLTCSTASKSYFAKPSIKQFHHKAILLTQIRAEAGPREFFCQIWAMTFKSSGLKGPFAVTVPGQNSLYPAMTPLSVFQRHSKGDGMHT